MNDWVMEDNGVRQSFATGAVRDTRKGKGRYDLFPVHAMKRLAIVYEKGAEKYGENNWQKGMPYSRFVDSALRHIYCYLEGKQEEDHIAMAAWNLMAVMELEKIKPEMNDLKKRF